MSADDRDREPAAPSRRRFLKHAGALVAAAPVVVALEATAQTAKPPAKKPAAPARNPFASAGPDLSIARNAEEREALERRWKNLQQVLATIRKAPLDPAAEPAAAFAALPMPPRPARGRERDDDEDEEE